MITGFMSQGLSSFYTANYDGEFKHRVYGASLTIWLNKAEKKPAPKTVVNTDIDFDGVPDATDLCPTVFGDSLFHGCPADKDNDGVTDIKDKCPEIPGLQKYDGCPVPDSDKDGVNDEQDSCKQIAGLPKYNGCPIPDKDGDSVNDEQDQCPDTPGSAGNNGCPDIEKVQQTISTEATQIFFASNSDKLTASSWEAINTVAGILKNNPKLIIVIEGYTDNSGTDVKNIELSKKRAAATKKALEKSGVNASRITTVGFGPQNPIADNTTPEGRLKNRRVEIKIQ
jgi:outer membrane protein OmpA-like peptidoglycan-associated protein